MTRKTTDFEEWSWFKFNNLRRAVPMPLTKVLKLKFRKFWNLIPTFAEVTLKNLGVAMGVGAFCPQNPE